jgi:hypothetical protein
MIMGLTDRVSGAKRELPSGQAMFFVVVPDRARLADLGRRRQLGRVRPIVGSGRPIAKSAAAFASGLRVRGRTIIAVAEND